MTKGGNGITDSLNTDLFVLGAIVSLFMPFHSSKQINTGVYIAHWELFASDVACLKR